MYICHICICVAKYVYVYTVAYRGQKRALGSLELDFQASCKPPDMDVGNTIPVF